MLKEIRVKYQLVKFHITSSLIGVIQQFLVNKLSKVLCAVSNLNFHQIEITTYLPKDGFFIIILLYNSKINYAVWGGSL